MGTMTAVVVGGSSPVGQHLVQRLTQIRYRVRNESWTDDGPELLARIRGADSIFCMTEAESLSARGLSPKGVAETVQRHRLLLESAYHAEIKCLVHSSPAISMGFTDRSDLIRDERSTPRRRLSAADRLVRALEETSLEFGDWTGLPVVAVRPVLAISPVSYSPSLADEPIRAALAGRSIESRQGGLTVAHVQDLADGHILASRRGEAGETYILGGQRVEIDRYLDLIRDLVPLSEAPGRSGARRGWFPRLRLAVGGGATVDSPQRWEDLTDHYAWFRCDKAIDELGYFDRSVEESIRDVLDESSSQGPSRQAA